MPASRNAEGVPTPIVVTSTLLDFFDASEPDHDAGQRCSQVAMPWSSSRTPTIHKMSGHHS